jgi:hypothetical protein
MDRVVLISFMVGITVFVPFGLILLLAGNSGASFVIGIFFLILGTLALINSMVVFALNKYEPKKIVTEISTSEV